MVVSPDSPDDDLANVYWYPPTSMPPHHTIGFYSTPACATAMDGLFGDRRYVRWTEQNILEGTIAVTEGAKVISADGEHVGDIEQIQIDPASGYATYVLIPRDCSAFGKQFLSYPPRLK